MQCKSVCWHSNELGLILMSDLAVRPFLLQVHHSLPQLTKEDAWLYSPKGKSKTYRNHDQRKKMMRYTVRMINLNIQN